MKLKTLVKSALVAVACTSLLPGFAHAEVITLAPHERTITTSDGWHVTLRLDNEKWNRVPPTNMTGTSREGYGSMRSVLTIGGKGTALQGAQLEIGYMVGCFADLSTVTLGGSVPVQVGTVNTVGISPSVQVSVTPGQIQTIPLEKKNLQSGKTTLQIRDAHLNVDNCLGPVQVRAYASVVIDSQTTKDGNAVYGDTFPI